MQQPQPYGQEPQPYGRPAAPHAPSFAPGARPGAASRAAPTSRARFIERTYAHLAGAIFAFVGLEALLLNSQLGLQIAQTMLSVSWLLVLGLFMVAGAVATSFASRAQSPGMQYLGLGLYVVIEAIIFLPLLMIANLYSMEHGGSVILPAGVTTLAVFAGITGYVFVSKANFSWLRGGLVAASIAAMVVIVFALLFGFHLGLLFMGAMVLLAAGYVLYTTSNILHEYSTDQHVAAALALFAAIALMFWYIVQIFMGRN